MAAFVALLALGARSAVPTVACAPVVATLVSIEGSVKVAPSPGGALHDAVADEPLCAGSLVEVGDRSRAALRLPNETTLRLDQRSRLVLTGFAADQPSSLDLRSGALHVITRTRRRLDVTTPFINASINGTEFTVRVDAGGARVTVFEGEVEARRGSEAVALASGESVTSRPDQPLRKELVVRKRDAVQWALYYPAVFDCDAAAASVRWRAADAAGAVTALCRQGRFTEAIARLDAAAEANDASASTFRAGMLLAVGRYDEATTAIADALRSDPSNGLAYALQSIVALVQAGTPEEALTLAQKAVTAGNTTAARIALSYAQQAQGRVDAARATIEAIPPDARTAAAWARLAELELARGAVRPAQAAADNALRLDPASAKAHTMQGYAYLLGTDLKAARDAFARAIESDQADPLPRLGLGLATIRAGDLEGGRAMLEVAAILDPGSSIVRSYLGKSYYEEKRDPLAARQYELARELDPNDPTPWLYDAILQHVQNRPVSSLDSIAESSRRNDNRAVYRSRLLLDDDQAARSANRAGIYGELGFEKLSISESAAALTQNFTNDAAHRQLATSYADLPRHDIARVSEALQAQVRQPLTATPVDPLIATDRLLIPRDTGPARLGTNEYNQLFSRNQVRLQADAISGTLGTFGDEVIVSGVADRIAFAASQLHYETDGFVENNATRKNAYDAFLQVELAPGASLQLDGRWTDFSLEQTFFRFDPNLAFPTRITERNDLGRVGGHWTLDAASDWVWSVFYQDRTRIVAYAPDPSLFQQDDTTTTSGEAQYTRSIPGGQLVMGVVVTSERIAFPQIESDLRTRANTFYAYSTVGPERYPVKFQLGLSWDVFRLTNAVFGDNFERNRVNPKLGVVWTPLDGTTVRAAAMSSVKRPFVASQTLEPTQIAGFNQFFTGYDNLYGDQDGTVSRRAAIAVDQRFGSNVFAGAEYTARNMKVPNFNVGETEWKERTAYAYVYRTFGRTGSRWQGSVTADYEYEKLERPQLNTGAEGIIDVTTQRLQLGARAFDVSGVTLRGAVSYVKQSGSFSADINSAVFDKDESGWITDVSLDWRLPQRFGTLGVGVRNLFDKRLDLFETDPINPRFATRRLVFAKLQLLF